MQFALLIFFLTLSILTNLYSMDASSPTNELHQLIQLNVALQQKIKELEEKKAQEELLIAQRNQELLAEIRQNKKFRKQFAQWTESGMWTLISNSS